MTERTVIVNDKPGAVDILKDFIGYTLKDVKADDGTHTAEMPGQIRLEFDEPEQEQPKDDCNKRRFTLDEEEEIYQNMVSEIRDGDPDHSWEQLTTRIMLAALERQVIE